MTLKRDEKFEEKLTLGSKKNVRNLVNFNVKSDSNIEEKLNFCLKNDMRNLVNFNASSGKSENLHYDRLLLYKLCNV